MLEIATTKSRMYTPSGIRYKTQILNCPICNKSLRFQTVIGEICYHCKCPIPKEYQFAHQIGERTKYHANI